VKEKIKKLSALRTQITPHNAGMVVLGIILLSVSWSSAKAIQRNHDLQKQVSQLEQEIAVQALENETQKLRNEFYKTDEFLELAARRQFGRAAPGETVLVVPREVAARYIQPPTTTLQAEQQADNRPQWQQNFSAWLDFLLGRSDT
jgi:cell division protein FtsB